jgi:hypothetical protein
LDYKIHQISLIKEKDSHSLMFHIGNIIQVARDTRRELNLKRLEIRDSRSASLKKKHINGAEIIVNPAMKEVNKEDKDQGFKI